MIRTSTLVRGNDIDAARVIDRVVLAADERQRRRIMLTGEKGSKFLLDLPQTVALRDGDGLVLDDGSIVLVAGKPEAVLDIVAAGPSELARLAWHLGNRHTEVQIVGEMLRIRADHVLEKMLKHLGAQVTAREAAFDPESGAYGQAIGQLASHGLGRAPAPGHGHAHAPGGDHHHHDHKS